MAAPALSTPFQPYVYQSPQAAVTPFQILGGEAQVVQVMLKPQERLVSRTGSLCYMSGSVEVEPPVANENEGGGILQWLVGKVNPTTVYVNAGSEDGFIGLSAPCLARILPIDLPMFGGEITCQRGAYLCSINDVKLSTTITYRARAGFFGGEGLLMQKLTGRGLAFIVAGGSVVQKNLAQGEVLVVDAGCVLAMTKFVQCELKYSVAVKWTFLGGEGLLQARLTGPGVVFIQSLPFPRFAQRIARAVAPPHIRENPRIVIQLGIFALMAYILVASSLLLADLADL